MQRETSAKDIGRCPCGGVEGIMNVDKLNHFLEVFCIYAEDI